MVDYNYGGREKGLVSLCRAMMMIGGLCEMLFEVLFGFLDCLLGCHFQAVRTATEDTFSLALDYFVHSTTTEAYDFAHGFLLLQRTDCG
jgi:hypothetical protein